MREDEARAWIRDRYGVSRETLVGRYAALLTAEAARQNLIAASTLQELWQRHIVDSAQLIGLGNPGGGTWIDIGSGAGLPGLVVAILTDRRVVLVEPRARRVEFLEEAARVLGLSARVEVVGSKIESYQPASSAAVISARAVAELSKLFVSARHCAAPSTTWVLPKGRNVQSEVEAARRSWQGEFHVEPSITAPDSGIVVARGVRPR